MGDPSQKEGSVGTRQLVVQTIVDYVFWSHPAEATTTPVSRMETVSSLCLLSLAFKETQNGHPFSCSPIGNPVDFPAQNSRWRIVETTIQEA